MESYQERRVKAHRAREESDEEGAPMEEESDDDVEMEEESGDSD